MLGDSAFGPFFAPYGLALDFAGADRLLAGSDYPHMIGSLDKMKASIAALELPPEDEAKVLGGNAARLLGIASA